MNLNKVEQQSRSPWQPIETAPKDGTKIDLWNKSYGRLACCCWDEKKARWQHWWVNSLEEVGWVNVDGVVTHWMPIPEPPTP